MRVPDHPIGQTGSGMFLLVGCKEATSSKMVVL